MAYPVTVISNSTRWIAMACAVIVLSSCQSAETTDERDEPLSCERAHPDSVSCGWPVYLPDGTRIDEPSGVVADA